VGIDLVIDFTFNCLVTIGGLFLKAIPLDDLSGLILTLLVAIASMILSFPLGYY
jgi:hypothetical protein